MGVQIQSKLLSSLIKYILYILFVYRIFCSQSKVRRKRNLCTNLRLSKMAFIAHNFNDYRKDNLQTTNFGDNVMCALTVCD